MKLKRIRRPAPLCPECETGRLISGFRKIEKIKRCGVVRVYECNNCNAAFIEEDPDVRAPYKDE